MASARSRITDIQAYDRLPRSSGERQLPEHVRIRNVENLQITQTYGPALARWFVHDPMADAYPGWSPYY